MSIEQNSGKPARQSFTDRKTPLWRAQYAFQADLSLFEVAKLTFPDPDTTAAATAAAMADRKDLLNLLLETALDGNLPVYGNPDGWLADEYAFDESYNKVWSSRVYPLAEKHQGTPAFPMEATNVTSGGLVKIKKWNGDNCLVSRADYFAFLKTPLALGIPSPDHWLPPPAESIPPESPLPLNERARLGLLVAETELPVWEILELEFPTKSSQQRGEYADWQDTIETAIDRGLLVSRTETRITQGETCLTGDWLIDRESYRQWRVTQPNPPAGSHIRLWLGATPPAESIPPVETSLPEKQERPDVIKHAIRAAIAVLSPSGALPRPPELFDYILQNSGKGNKFPDLTVKGKSLLWTADNGSRKEFDIRALTERLRRWKG